LESLMLSVWTFWVSLKLIKADKTNTN
jgi:hypothetical protein